MTTVISEASQYKDLEAFSQVTNGEGIEQSKVFLVRPRSKEHSS